MLHLQASLILEKNKLSVSAEDSKFAGHHGEKVNNLARTAIESLDRLVRAVQENYSASHISYGQIKASLSSKCYLGYRANYSLIGKFNVIHELAFFIEK